MATTTHELLAPHTTFHIGGHAETFVTVETEAELVMAINEAKAANWPLLVLGGGSNVLIADSGFAGMVIKMLIPDITYEVTSTSTVFVTVGAGVVFDELVHDTVLRGYWGLENLAAIPGTVGATPIQNVGAYGVEVADVIETVRVYDTKTGLFKNLTVAECQFGYRDSLFKQSSEKNVIVVGVTFRLSTVPQPKIGYKDIALVFGDTEPATPQALYDAVTMIRSKKFPDWHVVGTAGSFFKNPIVEKEIALSLQDRFAELPLYDTDDGQVKVSLGYVLDKICGLRGYTEGRVGLYTNQALVVVAERGATAIEVMAFAEKIKTIVREKTSIEIESEVTYIT